jgi:hypothetical protein
MTDDFIFVRKISITGAYADIKLNKNIKSLFNRLTPLLAPKKDT